MMTRCRHCRKPIVFIANAAEPFWYHPKARSVFCEVGAVQRGQP